MKRSDKKLVARLEQHFSEGDRVTAPLLCRAWLVNYNESSRLMGRLEALGAIKSVGRFKVATFI